MLLLLGEPLPSHLFWDVAAHREHHTHRLVPEVGGLTEHARAAAVDYGNALLAAVARGRLGDAPGAGATVHPNVLDAELGTLAHRLLGDLGPGRDHDRIDTIGDRAQIVVAAVPLDLLGVRVDGEHIVSPLAQALVDDVAPMILRMPRDACSPTRLLARTSAADSSISSIHTHSFATGSLRSGIQRPHSEKLGHSTRCGIGSAHRSAGWRSTYV